MNHVAAGKPRNIRGWKPDRPDHRDHIFKPKPTTRAALSHDNSQFCSRTEDQSSIGSCTAQAGTSGMEMFAIKNGLVRKHYSRLFVYWFTRVEIEGGDPRDDSGAYIRDTMKCLDQKHFGASPEWLWPYDISKFADKPTPQAIRRAKNFQITEYLRCLSLTSIKTSIALGFPVIGGFAVPETMFTPECEETGIVPFPRPSDAIVGGHAVLFTGYDDSRKLIKFQNSWSQQWGDKGFGYLPYQYVQDYLADDFWTIRMQEGKMAA